LIEHDDDSKSLEPGTFRLPGDIVWWGDKQRLVRLEKKPPALELVDEVPWIFQDEAMLDLDLQVAKVLHPSEAWAKQPCTRSCELEQHVLWLTVRCVCCGHAEDVRAVVHALGQVCEMSVTRIYEDAQLLSHFPSMEVVVIILVVGLLGLLDYRVIEWGCHCEDMRKHLDLESYRETGPAMETWCWLGCVGG
jgi:hypothetical protein